MTALLRPLATGALASFLTLVALAGGALEPLERPLIDLRMSLLQRAADPAPVLIEIDPQSIHEIGRWPWPRSLHALLLDRLTAAGAGQVYLDVEFSLASEEEEDAALESALQRRQGRTTMAGFRQWSESLGGYIDAGPLARFSAATSLASANLIPSSDGLIREFSLSYPWQEGRLPAMAAAIAGVETGASDRFLIDYGIDPGTFTRFSFVDVARGDVDPALLRGRPVVVGATAIELGDILSVPRHRVLAGVEVQMLAAQSLLLNRALSRLPFWVLGLAVPAFALGLLLAGLRFRDGRALAVALGAGNVVLWGGAVGLQAALPMVLDVVPFTLASFGAAGLALMLRFRKVAARLVSETVARRRTERLMGAVAKNAFDALVTTDAAGRVSFINGAAGRMFGVGIEDLEDLSISRFFARPDLLKDRDLGDVLHGLVALGRPRRLVCRRANGELF